MPKMTMREIDARTDQLLEMSYVKIGEVQVGFTDDEAFQVAQWDEDSAGALDGFMVRNMVLSRKALVTELRKRFGDTKRGASRAKRFLVKRFEDMGFTEAILYSDEDWYKDRVPS